MTQLTRYAERLKLAHLMGVDAESLTFMDRLPADAITGLRRQISNTLFDANSAMFQRVAASSRLLPISLLTVIAEKAIGPWLSAHIAGHMPVDRAIDMAKRLPVPFLADVCMGIDPRRVKEIIRGVPIDRSMAVSRELVRRRDFITMGRFIDALPDTTLSVLLNDMQDDEALLMIAFYVEDRRHLDHVIGLIPDDRISRVIDAAHRLGLWHQALALMRFVSPASCRRLGDIAARQSDEALDSMLIAADEYDLWSEVLPILSFMSEHTKRRFINLPNTDNQDILQSIIDTARQLSLWPELLPLLRLKDGKNAFSLIAANMGETTLREIMAVASAHDLWHDVLDQVEHFEEERQAALALALARTDDAELESLMRAVKAHDRWQQLINIATGMSPETHQYLIENGITQDRDIVTRIIRASERAGVWNAAITAFTTHIDILIQLLEKLPGKLQQQLLEEALEVDASLLLQLVNTASGAGISEAILRMLDASSPDIRMRLPALLESVPAERQDELRQHAEALGLKSLLSPV